MRIEGLSHTAGRHAIRENELQSVPRQRSRPELGGRYSINTAQLTYCYFLIMDQVRILIPQARTPHHSDLLFCPR